MQSANDNTVKIEHVENPMAGRGPMSEVRRHAMVPAWRPARGARVTLSNGFGQRIPAEIMTAVQPTTREFGVRVFAWQTRGPWHWLPLASRGVTWWPAPSPEDL